MLLKKLPLELVQQIVRLVLQDNNPRNLTALLGTNKALETVTTDVYMRSLQELETSLERWQYIPLPIRRSMARDIIMSKPDPGFKFTIATYMHAVASYLSQYSQTFDASATGRLSHTQWLHEICSVLAPSEADCVCDKPAFMHSRCYSLASVPGTAFHVAILKRYTRLETVMIADGKGAGSVCPYLKVSKRNPMLTRRNALEWACAYGFDDTVHRLVSAAENEMKRPEEYLPTAAAICAVRIEPRRCNTKLLHFLLDRLSIQSWSRSTPDPIFTYHSRRISFKEWNRIVLSTLVQHRNKAAICTLRRSYPYLEFSSTVKLLHENWCHEHFSLMAIAKQRPHCEFMNTSNTGPIGE